MKTEERAKFHHVAALAFAGAIAVGATSMAEVAYAQTSGESDQLQEVVVTAERRVQDVQKIAASVSVRTGAELAAQGRYTLEEILQTIPGLQGGESINVGSVAGAGTDSPANNVVIRGIKSNGGAAGSITSGASSAATYVDDVYQGVGNNFDIARVEVLRGPQGTLYGRSAVSGAVGTYTNNPTLDKVGGSATVEYGSNDVGAQEMNHFTGAVNIPLSDQFAVRVSGNRYRQGGTWFNRSNLENTQTSGRIKILYKPSDNLSILVSAADQKNKRLSGGDGVTITQPSPDQIVFTEVAVGAVYPGYNETRQLWARLDWNLGFGTLTYIPALREYTSNQITDLASNTPECLTETTPHLAPLNAITNPTGLRATGFTCIRSPQLTPFDHFDTHEIRIASNPDSKLIWQAGGMYYLNRLRNSTDTEYVSPVDGKNNWVDSCINSANHTPNAAGPCTKGGGTPYSLYSKTIKTTEATGLFAEATYPFTDTFRFTGGLRYDDTKVTNNQYYYAHASAVCVGDKSQFVDVGATLLGIPITTCRLLADSGKREYKNTNWKARVEYDVAPEHLLYGTISTGSSPGDVTLSTGVDSQPEIRALESETLTSYDLGSKNRFLDNRLQLNGEAYFQDYGGYQQNVNIGTAGAAVFATLILPVRFYGFDGELVYQLTSKDRLGLNVGYTHGWFLDRNRVVYTTVAGVVTTLADYAYFRTIYGIVPWTVNASYDRSFNVARGSKLNWHIDAKYTSPYYPALLGKTDVITNGIAPYTHVSSAYVANTNLMWTSAEGMYSVNAYVKNLFDNRYKTGCGMACPPAAPTATVANPRSFGVAATVNF